jgi:hypothetical protein
LLFKALKLKEKLMSPLQNQIVENDMYINQVQINKMKKELAELKEDYAEMIVKSYKKVVHRK